MSTAELLPHLRDYLSAWRQLQWRFKTVVKIDGACDAYELVAGVFAKADSNQLTLTWLPSRYEDKYSTLHHDLGFVIRDFAMDPTQDLVAILQESHSCAQFSL